MNLYFWYVREFRCNLWFERSAEARAYWFLLCPRSLGPSVPKFKEPLVTECIRDHLCPRVGDYLCTSVWDHLCPSVRDHLCPSVWDRLCPGIWDHLCPAHKDLLRFIIICLLIIGTFCVSHVKHCQHDTSGKILFTTCKASKLSRLDMQSFRVENASH